MSETLDVRVPDIGDFSDVPVIEIHVSAGDEVAPEDPLVTLESDKATMDVPAPFAGTVNELQVKIGDLVSQGTLLLTLDAGEVSPAPSPPPESVRVTAEAPPAAPEERDVQVVVIGSGPGGYTAAFRAADLGLRTMLVERYEALGGVCLNVGCIPSKALLHAARVVAEVEEMAEHGITFGPAKLDLDALRSWKESVVGRLTGGVRLLARQRKVEVLRGIATFTGPHTISVADRTISFEHCIIAAGSSAAQIPGLPEDDRIIDSTDALELRQVPKRLLVIGGGIIGLEMGTVYEALGSDVTVVELLGQLIPGCDPDLVEPLRKRLAGRYQALHLGTEVGQVTAQKSGLKVTLSSGRAETFDQVLVAVGRRPNGHALGAENAGVAVSEAGFIPVDDQMRTNISHIFAIGDVANPPLLAHKATHQGKVAAEVIAGQDVVFDPRAIPSVAYTDPEIAWAGLTEPEAQEQGLEYDKAVFPWAASGRALSLTRPEGLTKLLFDRESRRLLGAGITGVGAGELIAEAVHALEMGSDADDLALTIHPHPTLSETVGFAAELAQGTITDLLAPQRKRSG